MRKRRDASTYVLENPSEFSRLERQSRSKQCSLEDEFKTFKAASNEKVLDAGCGSGVVSRYLATRFPFSKIVACDFSASRIEQARREAQAFHNIEFRIEDLTKVSLSDASFDSIVCRYVLEHLDPVAVKHVADELFRLLKGGGEIFVVDIDGVFGNLFPETDTIRTVISDLEARASIDLRVGRKIPHHLSRAGFTDVKWGIQTIECSGEVMEVEIELMRQRFESFTPFLGQFLGDELKAHRFEKEYIATMQRPDAVLFYNKFIVSGKKPPA